MAAVKDHYCGPGLELNETSSIIGNLFLKKSFVCNFVLIEEIIHSTEGMSPDVMWC
jgi:hypothetical protein